MREKQRRYEQTPKGKATKQRYNAKRIWLNKYQIVGTAPTEAEARAIQAHIRERKREFIARQSARAEAKGGSLGAVQAQATAGGD